MNGRGRCRWSNNKFMEKNMGGEKNLKTGEEGLGEE